MNEWALRAHVGQVEKPQTKEGGSCGTHCGRLGHGSSIA